MKLIFSVSIICLIVAKITPIIHVEMTNYYLDLDRAVALILVIGLFFRLFKEDFLSPFLTLIGFTTGFIGVASLLGIDPVKAAILVLMTALVEEIVLRAVVLEWALAHFSKWTSVFGAAVLFTLVHPAVYSAPLYGGLVFITGVILGAVYLYGSRPTQFSLRTDVDSAISGKSVRRISVGVVYATMVHSVIILAGLLLNII
ncbi:MAG: CPBP family intramembrane metalloprotease [Gammaproteobacteria bacterium]|nr:CPBP family intramembrane metalloprotease [Gammaproteobacteria bacterium]